MPINEVLAREEERIAKRRAYNKMIRDQQVQELMKNAVGGLGEPAVFSQSPFRTSGRFVVPFSGAEAGLGMAQKLGQEYLNYRAQQAGQDVAEQRSADLAERFGSGEQVTPEALLQSPDPELQRAGLELAMRRAQNRYQMPHVSSTQAYNLPSGEIGLGNVLSTGEWKPIEGVTRPRELQSVDTGTDIYRVPKQGPQEPVATFPKQLPPQAPHYHPETGTLFDPNIKPGVAGSVQTISKPGYQAKAEQETRQKVIDEVEKSYAAQSAVMNTLDAAILPLLYAEEGGEPHYNNVGNLVAPSKLGVLTSHPSDRLQKLTHDMLGIPDVRAERTKALEAAAAKLTLSIGSLGNQVSDKDRETYEKAFGQFQKAQTGKDMIEAINMMRRAHKAIATARGQVQEQVSTGAPVNTRVEPLDSPQAIRAWYRQDPANREAEALKRLEAFGRR